MLSFSLSMTYSQQKWNMSLWYILWISVCRGIWGDFSWCPSSSSKRWFGILWPHLACRHGAHQVNRSVATQRVCMFPKQLHFFLLGAGVERVANWQHSLQLLVFAESDAQHLVCWCHLGCLDLRNGLLKFEALHGGARYYCTCSHCWWDRIASWIKRILSLRQVLCPSISLMLWDGKIVPKFNCWRQFGFIASLKPQVSHRSSGPAAPSWDGKCEGDATLGLLSSTRTYKDIIQESLVIHEDSCRLDLNCRWPAFCWKMLAKDALLKEA